MMIKNERGQSLFEVLVAVALAAIIVTSVASVATISLSNSEFARTNSEARQVTQILLEDARKHRDTNPECIQNENCAPSTTCPAGFDSCIVNFTYSGGDTANVTATVQWTDGRGVHTVTAQTILTAWQD